VREGGREGGREGFREERVIVERQEKEALLAKKRDKAVRNARCGMRSRISMALRGDEGGKEGEEGGKDGGVDSVKRARKKRKRNNTGLKTQIIIWSFTHIYVLWLFLVPFFFCWLFWLDAPLCMS